MQDNRDVWVFIEPEGSGINRVSLKAMQAGLALAGKLGSRADAVVMGHRIDPAGRIIGGYGARRVYLVDDILLGGYNPDAYVNAFVGLTKAHSPSVIILGATSTGADLAPRLAVRLRAGYLPGCTALDVDATGRLTGTRPVFNGRLSATVAGVGEALRIATLLPGGAEPEANRLVTAEIIRFQPGLKRETIRTELLEVVKADPRTIDVTEADIVVAGGRGVGSQDNFRLVQRLADLLGGAVGGTRPTVDAGWLPYERQIGLTGKTVAPKLLISCGISGQNAHSAATEGALIKVAINIDPNAPVFKAADIGIVGDLREVIPALITELDKIINPE